MAIRLEALHQKVLQKLWEETENQELELHIESWQDLEFLFGAPEPPESAKSCEHVVLCAHVLCTGQESQ